MPYHQQHHSDLDVFETVYTGVVSADELQKAIDEGNDFHLKQGVENFLADLSELQSAPTILDVFDLPRQYDNAGVTRSSRMAVVIPKSREMQSLAEFYETVCLNRGWNVRLFETRDEAVSWLQSDGLS